MFDELKAMVDNSELGSESKVAVSVLLKAASWFPWVFVGIGLLLETQYFIYWLIFFMFIEGALLLALIYVLTLLVKSATGKTPGRALPDPPKSAGRSLLRRAADGVLGNVAFYLVIVVVLVLVKLTGIADAVLDQVLQTLGQ